MNERQTLAAPAQSVGDAPTEPGAVDSYDRVGPQPLHRRHGLPHPPQDQRRARQYLRDTGDGEIGERDEARQAFRPHPLAADPLDPQSAVGALAQGCDQRSPNRVARRLAGNDEDERRGVMRRGHGARTPTTNRPAASAARMTSSRSRTMVAPASAAIPRSPVS